MLRDRFPRPERKTVAPAEQRTNAVARTHPKKSIALDNGEKFDARVAKRFEDPLDGIGRVDGRAMADQCCQVDRALGGEFKLHRTGRERARLGRE